MLEFSTRGIIDTAAIAKALEPTLGKVRMLRFRPELQGFPQAVRFEVITEREELLAGQVFVHAIVTGDEIFSWGEIVLPPAYYQGEANRGGQGETSPTHRPPPRGSGRSDPLASRVVPRSSHDRPPS